MSVASCATETEVREDGALATEVSLRATGTTLNNPGESAIIRRGRNHLIKCRFGARFAGLAYKRWTGSKFEKETIEVDTTETYLYNDTGRDATLKLSWKDPSDRGNVRVTRLSSFSEKNSNPGEVKMLDPSQSEAQDPAAIVFTEEEMSTLDLGSSRTFAGGVVSVRIFFEVQGAGSFVAGGFNTLDGAVCAWVKPGAKLNLSATPASGWKFSHWLLNGQWGGAKRRRGFTARKGLRITAVFTRKNRSAERSNYDTWRVEGPGGEYEGHVQAGWSEVTFEYDEGTAPGLEMWINDRQKGNLGPGASSHAFPCSPGDKPKVVASSATEPGQYARGAFAYE